MAERTDSSQRRRLIGWRVGPFVALAATSCWGPWPLWRWGTRIGWAFDLGYLRVGVRWR